MSEHHGNLVIRFYPQKGEWTCIVQRVDSDGMPIGGDLVSSAGKTKEEARDRAIGMTGDQDVQDALRSHRVR
jgi:hypothetical protein